MIDPLEIIATNSTDIDKEIFNVNVSEYVKCCNRLRSNLESAFNLFLGQCTELTLVQLEGLPTW